MSFKYLDQHGEISSFTADDQRCQLISSEHVCLDGRVQPYGCLKNAEDMQIWWGGEVYTLALPTSRRKNRQGNALSGGLDLHSQMPGTILQVLVDIGDLVSAGQSLILMESMKMEMNLESPSDGVVSQILFQTGDRVDRGALLLQLKQASGIGTVL